MLWHIVPKTRSSHYCFRARDGQQMQARAMNQVGREAPRMRAPVVISASTTGGGGHDMGGADAGRDVGGFGSDSPADVSVDGTPGAAAHLKKQRRNERDRRRSLLKRVRAV